jgi:putative membrane protein
VSKRALIVFAAISCMPAARVCAHDGELGAAHLVRAWTWDPWLSAALLASALLYFRGELALRQRAGWLALRPPLCFALGWLSLTLALLSPLDFASDRLFWAHMLQHELLMMIAAPLFVFARPLERYVWALPAALRARVLRAWSRPDTQHWQRRLTGPAFALALHAAARWIWHVPALFEAALAHPCVHAIQHAMFFFTALLFWWSLIQGRYGRLGYGVSVLFVFATGLHTGALGALITVARHAWYPSYVASGARLGFDALRDQQWAGLIMWILAGTICTALGVSMCVAWLLALQRRSRIRAQQQWHARAAQRTAYERGTP